MLSYFRKLKEKWTSPKPALFYGMIGEFIGTYMMLVFGLGVIVQTEILETGFVSISLGWGLAVMLGVFWAGRLGPGLINPAVVIGFAVIRKVKWLHVPFYIVAELLGAMFGALTIIGVYYDKLSVLSFTMEKTGKFFVTAPHVSLFGAFADQFFGTFLLASCALAIIDKNGFDVPDFLHPFMLGLMVTGIVGCFAINAGAALNPARDLGPRIALSICGWGKNAFSNSNFYFWVPILAPILGAVTGCVMYAVFVQCHLATMKAIKEEKQKSQISNSSTESLTVNIIQGKQ